jgi:hypothetical protein
MRRIAISKRGQRETIITEGLDQRATARVAGEARSALPNEGTT